MTQSYWIWYPGDFEIYHALLQNFDREERGFDWPAFWYQDDCRKNVRFFRTYELSETTTFTVYSKSCGYILANGKKHKFGERIVCGPGTVKLDIFAGQITGVPAIYIEGEQIHSDLNWMVTDFASEAVKAAYSSRYTKKEQDPSIWEYQSELVKVQKMDAVNGGVLYDFGRELTAVLKMQFTKEFHPVHLCYGESVEEATDTQNCYYDQQIVSPDDTIRKRAFRYCYIPDCTEGEIELIAEHMYVDIPVRASFKSEDKELNKIWEVCCETFKLCSGIFFIDGVKRDRWIWSGDAYQSYMVNPYLFFDEEINKRTILALRGNDPVRQQMNTILDYSMYWVISVYNHYEMTGDVEFVHMVYPKIITMMEFLESGLDEHGFIVGRPGDWIFIDWSDLDKEGALCAEQMLLLACYRSVAALQDMLGEDDAQYQKKFAVLKEQIEQYFWSEEKQAYVDSFSSGKNHVTRHANIFAILFQLVDEKRAETLYQTVLCNDAITQITTPYFKFYELDVLCKLGHKKQVLEQMKDYWGGIIAQGAVTVWEQYDPNVTGKERYAMYGDPYGKSLCHAWGASPIYLLGRYFMGVERTDIAYRSFKAAPETEILHKFDCTVPVKGGFIKMKWDGNDICVLTDCKGGMLIFEGKEYSLQPNVEQTIESRNKQKS